MAAEMMPESSYGFRPTPEVADVRRADQSRDRARTIRSAVRRGFRPGVQKQAAPALAAVKSKPAIVAALKESIAYCDRVLAAATEAWLMEVAPGLGGSSSGLIPASRAHSFIYNAVHSAEDFGTITTYLRMQGVVPPSTALPPPKK